MSPGDSIEADPLAAERKSSTRFNLLMEVYTQELTINRTTSMTIMTALPIAAAGYSLIYLLFGGGFGGAILIFIIAKMIGK